MYKNIIFDLGNVLLNYNPEEYLKNKIEQADVVSEVYREIFKSEEWAMLDKGVITEEEAIDIIVNRNIKNERFIRLAFENWYELLTPIEDSIRILEQLKTNNYNVYFLSNFHLLAFKNITDKYDFFKLFDGGIVSYKENLLKPQEAIYNRILKEYKLNPEESIFIDDMQENVEGAQKVGINTILFKSPNDLREKLRRFNICL